MSNQATSPIGPIGPNTYFLLRIGLVAVPGSPIGPIPPYINIRMENESDQIGTTRDGLQLSTVSNRTKTLTKF